jgi:peptide/nickel transport system permease protein
MSRAVDWLTDTAPASRMQANLGRAYLLMGALLRNPLAAVGIVIIVALIIAAIFAPLIAPYAPNAQNLANRLMPPSGAHWMGTDELGRDIFSRVIYGARITLMIVILVAVIAAPVGLIVGAVAGYVGGWTDRILMGITDIFLSMPRLILALAFVAVLGAGIENAVIAIALTAWPPYARIARSEVLTFRNSEFIAAVELQGASSTRIVLRHILPLCTSSMIIRVTIDMAGIILIAAGLGLPRPRRAAAAAGMGRDGVARAELHPRPVVGRHHAGLRDHPREPRVLLPRRRLARRARPQARGQPMTPLLEVEDLRVSFPGRQGRVEAVRGVGFTLGRERLGIVGESGSGKSLTGRAILRLIRPPGLMTAKAMRFDGTELTTLSERRMRAIRGARISMVMQDPKFSLNPVMTVGDQIAEVLFVHAARAASARRRSAWPRCSTRCASPTPSAWRGSTRTRSRAGWASG